MTSKQGTDAGSLKRGVALMKLLATAGRRGLALTEIAAAAGLPHPSVHRLLRQLIEEGLAEHSPETRRYKLGRLTFELGVASSVMHDIRDLCAPSMETLARDTGDTIYLVVRSGFDAVCMHRLEGSYPIRTLVLEVGSRRPLGIGAGGLAILAATPDDERSVIVSRVAPSLPKLAKLTATSLHEACNSAAAQGYALIRDRVTLGVSAIGMHFKDSMGRPSGALSVAAMSQRMTASRLVRIAAALRASTAEVEARLHRR
jgi:DNA-binding IclR family transcriptional regulator